MNAVATIRDANKERQLGAGPATTVLCSRRGEVSIPGPADPATTRVKAVSFTAEALVVHLTDGRAISVPLESFPRLRDATPTQRAHWELTGGGVGIHWTDLDEDISLAGLLGAAD
jgi:uncharacterized protein DUF2442